MSDNESTLGASDAPIPAENGSREVENAPPAPLFLKKSFNKTFQEAPYYADMWGVIKSWLREKQPGNSAIRAAKQQAGASPVTGLAIVGSGGAAVVGERVSLSKGFCLRHELPKSGAQKFR